MGKGNLKHGHCKRFFSHFSQGSGKQLGIITRERKKIQSPPFKFIPLLERKGTSAFVFEIRK